MHPAKVNDPLMTRQFMNATILLRCDGGAMTGWGHASRCLALAEAFVELGYRCLFVGRFDQPVQRRIEEAGMFTVNTSTESWSESDASRLVELSASTSARGLVVDSYLVSTDYLRILQAGRVPTLVIDDFNALSRYPCAAVLNFTSRAGDLGYERSDETNLFLGPRWFLARRSLRQARSGGVPGVATANRVLVTTGGNDPHGISRPALQSLSQCCPSALVRIVSTNASNDLADLHSIMRKFDTEPLILGPQPDLAKELLFADVVISSAGLTKYEAAYLGRPAAVFSQNAGQFDDAVRFEQLGMALHLGAASQLDQRFVDATIARIFDDQSLRERIQSSSLSIFPSDPTMDLAITLCFEVFAT